MTFAESVQTCFGKYVDFSGRARPSEYWWWVLFYIGGSIVAVLIDENLFALVLLGLILPTLAVSIRRLHDTGRSGWYYLLNLIPFGGIVVLVFLIQAGDPGPNHYGEPAPVRLST